MIRLRFAPVLIAALVSLGTLGLMLPAIAQHDDGPPVEYTPGVPLRQLTPGTTIIPEDDCYPPLPIQLNQTIYIKPLTNIRNQPTRSSAQVWNTIFDNLDDDGEVVDEPVSVPAIVNDGPICAEGYNWWRVVGLGNTGWVAEGRPDEFGYYLIVPGADFACASRFDFTLGETATVQYNVRVREAPSLQGRTRTVVPFESPVRVLAGPECIDGLLWWYVQATVAGFTYEGWMAEASDAGDLILPDDLPSFEDGTLCADPLPLAAGQRAYVGYRDGIPKSLRALPDTDATLLFTLVRGVPLVIEGGPVCSDNLNWWQVRVLASAEVVGWMAEGSPGVGYWIRTVDPDEYAR